MTSSPDRSGAAEAAQEAAEATPPVAVVAGHGDFAAGIVSAVAQIAGQGGRLVPMTNRGLGAAEIEARLREVVADGAVRVIFTDLPAGSCTIAARRLLRERPELRLVTGANLPAVLDFVLGADCAGAGAEDAADAARRLSHAVERGRGALMEVGAPVPTGGGAGAEVRGAH